MQQTMRKDVLGGVAPSLGLWLGLVAVFPTALAQSAGAGTPPPPDAAGTLYSIHQTIGVANEPFIGVASGKGAWSALTASGRVVSWGSSDSGRCRRPQGHVVQIQRWHDWTAALRADGSVVVLNGTVTKEAVGPFVQIDGSSLFGVLARRVDGSAELVSPYASQTLSLAGPYIDVAHAGNYWLALRPDGTVDGGGSNSYGQLNVPAGTYIDIDVAAGYSGGIRSDGTIVLWGAVPDGVIPPAGIFSHLELGSLGVVALAADGSVGCSYEPSLAWACDDLAGDAIAIAGGYDFSTCVARPDGSVDQVKAFDDYAHLPPREPFVGAAGYEVNAYDLHWAAIRSDGAAVVVPPHNIPLPPAILEGPYVGCAAGSDSVFLLGNNGSVQTFGHNLWGELDVPAANFVALSAGERHAAGLLADGSILAWGNDSWGQASPPPGTFTALACGGYHTVALRSDGTIVGWGDNWFGQTDDPGGTFVAIAAGLGHTVGLRPDGSVVAWGRNLNGECNIPPGAYRSIAATKTCTFLVREDGAFVKAGTGSSMSLPVADYGPMWRVFPGGIAIGGGADCDGDGVPNVIQIALGAPDLDGDGVPDACEANPADLDGDGAVGPADLALLLGAWGLPGPADLNGDGVVDAADLASLLGAWT